MMFECGLPLYLGLSLAVVGVMMTLIATRGIGRLRLVRDSASARALLIGGIIMMIFSIIIIIWQPRYCESKLADCPPDIGGAGRVCLNEGQSCGFLGTHCFTVKSGWLESGDCVCSCVWFP